MGLRIHNLCIYICMLVQVMDAIEGWDNGHAHDIIPENHRARIIEFEPEQKHEMNVEMGRAKPGEEEIKSNSGEFNKQNVNWLTQMIQYVPKLVKVTNWFPETNVKYYLTKAVNLLNYKPGLIVVKFDMSNDDENSSSAMDTSVNSIEEYSGDWEGIPDALKENKPKVEQGPQVNEVVGETGMMMRRHIMPIKSEWEEIENGPKVEQAAEDVEDIGETGMVMRQLILPASIVPNNMKSLPDTGGLLDTGGLISTVGEIVGGLLGNVLGTGRNSAGDVGGGGTSVDVQTRHKRSLILI